MSNEMPEREWLCPYDGSPTLSDDGVGYIRADLYEALRKELQAFPNLTAMRECMVETANENERLRKELTQLAIESKNRELVLAKLEAEVIAAKEYYGAELAKKDAEIERLRALSDTHIEAGVIFCDQLQRRAAEIERLTALVANREKVADQAIALSEIGFEPYGNIHSQTLQTECSCEMPIAGSLEELAAYLKEKQNG